MTDKEMLEVIRNDLNYFAQKYPEIGAFKTFYDALDQPMTYAEFDEKYKTLRDVEVRVEKKDYNDFMYFDNLMIDYMYARRKAGDTLQTTEKTIGRQNALLHVGRYNSHLLEMRGLLQRLGEMTTVPMHTDSSP